MTRTPSPPSEPPVPNVTAARVAEIVQFHSAAATAGATQFRNASAQMLLELRQNGIAEPTVLKAIGSVPRHLFVADAWAGNAYQDVALPIGLEQTISRPTTVGRMLAAVCQGLGVDRLKRIKALEVGTGCGYQAAVMAKIFGEVYSIERLRVLHQQARVNLRPFCLGNVRLVFGDGCAGLPGVAPFDAIVIAAAGPEVPAALLDQLAIGGRIVAPVGEQEQTLQLIERVAQYDWKYTELDAARFVPLRSGTG
jgi:protein-L-isoaspartate(D-aspartate) O-methyltransferase